MTGNSMRPFRSLGFLFLFCDLCVNNCKTRLPGTQELDERFGPTFAALRGPNGKHLPPPEDLSWRARALAVEALGEEMVQRLEKRARFQRPEARR